MAPTDDLDDDADDLDDDARKAAVVELAEAAAGELVPGLAVIKQAVRLVAGESAAAKVAAADAQLARARAHEVPALTARVEKLAADVRDLHQRDQADRLNVAAAECERLIAAGKLDARDLTENPELQAAMLESVRRSLEAVAVEAIPYLVRLAALHALAPDRVFRRVASALTALESHDLGRWNALVLACALGEEDGSVDLDVCVLPGDRIEIRRIDDRGTRWRPHALEGSPTEVLDFVQALQAAGVIRTRAPLDLSATRLGKIPGDVVARIFALRDPS